MENAIRAISNSNLTAEEKDALLRELANESIKKQQNENSFEAKRAKLVEKERQKAKETRERLEKYQKEAYRKEIIKNSKVKALEYINELAKIKNNHGEYIYKDLEKEYKDGKITEAEIYALYERINNNKMYEDLFKKLDENPVQDVADNNESHDAIKNKLKEKENKNENENENDSLKDDLSEDENEIVDVKDGSHITKKENFKNIAKKTLKWGAVLGAVGLFVGAIHYFVNTGDSNQIEEGLKTLADTVNNSALDIPDYSNITDVGDVKEVFVSNDGAMQNINALTPNEDYFQNEILGYTTSDNQMTTANNMEEVIKAYNNGEDISSLYVGNHEGIDGFVNEVNNQSLTDFLESKGGRVK